MIECHIALHLHEVCDILESASNEFLCGEIDRISCKIPLLSRGLSMGVFLAAFFTVVLIIATLFFLSMIMSGKPESR